MSANERSRTPEKPAEIGGGRGLELPVSPETEPLVMACGNRFCVTSRSGDIAPAAAVDLGLFHDDTRHLSYYELLVAGGPPIVLSADTAGVAMSQIDLTLSDTQFGGFLNEPQNFLHLRRKRLLDDVLVEQLILTNHLRRPIDLWVELRMAVDFADVFELRGARRARRGVLAPPQYAGDHLLFRYQGLDHETYRTDVRMNPEPRRLGPTGPFYELTLLPGEATILELVIEPSRGESSGPSPPLSFATRNERQKTRNRQFLAKTTRPICNNTGFDDALRHDLEDIDALRLLLPGGTIALAGIPWFAAPFGRDALITAYEMLSVLPDLAVDTLRVLAHYQGQKEDNYTEEEPGKIMHELRLGELARTGEAPHSPYYGSIDATPLWLVLYGQARRWLGHAPFVEELYPNALRALDWIERRLERGDGFIRYQRRHEKGLENQGWKDSREGVSYPDGTIAPAPIALVEVQGYAIAAFEAMAEVERVRGAEERALELVRRASEMRARLAERFLVPETRFYALALDGHNRRVPTIASNPGQLLFCRAVDDQTAARFVEVLLADELWSGYGVRTVARGQTVYNPLSYHNGSVWPHDNALIAAGMSLYGLGSGARQILEGMFEASRHFRRHRLPELFCGLGRVGGDFLVHYPVSCSPQAWASAAFFLLIHACVGLRPDAPNRQLVIFNPELPSFLDWFDLHGLRVGDSRVTLHFSRHGACTHVDVVEQDGAELRVQIEIG